MSQDGAQRELSDWRRRLLPFMRGALALMAAFFFAASLWQLHVLQREIRHPQLDLAASLSADGETLPLELRARLLLESDLIERRYRQANAVILARVWTRYLGFLTGMVLALVGAVFVLGRLQESQTEVGAEAATFKGSIATSSPGLVLAFLGTVLMAISLVVEFEIETKDAATYVARVAPAADMPPPRPMPEVETAAPALRCDPDSPFEEDRAGCEP